MPELKCTVQTCVHNQQFLCDLDKIQVGGQNAKQLSGEKRRKLQQFRKFRACRIRLFHH